MDRFELSVGEPDLDEERHAVVFVQKRFEILRARLALRRVAAEQTWRLPARSPAGPIQFWLRRSSPGVSLRSANAMQEILVNLTNQPNRDRQRLQTRKAAIHRLDVVHDFFDIAAAAPMSTSASAERRSCNELWVPSIWLESTASFRTYM